MVEDPQNQCPNSQILLLPLFLQWHLITSRNYGSNAFQNYFDDAKESRVKQVPRIKINIQDLRIIKIKIQDSSKESRLKIQESREDSIKISIKRFFQNIE